MAAEEKKGGSFLKKSLLLLAFIFLAPLVPMFIVALKPEVFRWAFLLFIPVALFAIFKPQPLPLMKTRLGAVGLMYLAGMAVFFGFSNKSENELLAMKERDPDAYLSYVKENRDDDNYLQALSEIRPEEHKAEVEKRAAEKAAEAQRKAEEEAAREAQRLAEKERRDEERRIQREAEEKEKIVKYVAQIEREIEALENFNPKTYLDSQTSLGVGLALFSAYAKIYKEGESLALSDDQEALRQTFRRKIISVQKRALPQFRDAYHLSINPLFH